MSLEMTLEDFYLKLYEPLRLLGKSQNAKRLLKCTIKKYSTFLGRRATLADLTDESVSLYLGALINEGSLSLHTIKKERCNLVSLWNYAAKRRMIDQFPAVAVIDAPDPIPVAWTMEELQKLSNTIQKLEGHFDGIPRSLWWLALFSVIWDSGERIGAVMALKWTDVRNGWLTINASTRKGKKKNNIVKLAGDTLEVLERLKEYRHSKLFPWPYSETYLWKHLSMILEAADLPADRRSKFHRIRRSVATHFSAAGGDAQKLLLHSHSKITEMYLDPSIVKPLQASDVLPSFGKKA